MKNSPASLEARNKKRAHWKAVIDSSTVPPTVLRLCKDCGELKPCSWNYSFTQTGKPEYRNRCPECVLSRLSKHRKKTRPQLSRAAVRRRLERKKKCVGLLGGKCAHCGYSKSIRALTFHHRDPTDKLGDVGSLLTLRAWSVILIELQKCVLLCFNCHMEEEERLDLLTASDVLQVSSSTNQ
jgi:hypothetical protein